MWGKRFFYIYRFSHRISQHIQREFHSTFGQHLANIWHIFTHLRRGRGLSREGNRLRGLPRGDPGGRPAEGAAVRARVPRPVPGGVAQPGGVLPVLPGRVPAKEANE